mgnify:CR=1 FL=1
MTPLNLAKINSTRQITAVTVPLAKPRSFEDMLESRGKKNVKELLKNPNQTFEKLVIFVNALMRFNDKIDPKKLSNAIETTNFKSLQNIENEGKFSENVYSLKDNRKIKFFYYKIKRLSLVCF